MGKIDIYVYIYIYIYIVYIRLNQYVTDSTYICMYARIHTCIDKHTVRLRNRHQGTCMSQSSFSTLSMVSSLVLGAGTCSVPTGRFG
jgi:hypothetical protein